MVELMRYAEPLIRRAHLLSSCSHADDAADLLWGLRDFYKLDVRLIECHMQEAEKIVVKLHTSLAVLKQYQDDMCKVCQELQERLDHDQTVLDLRVLSTSSCSTELPLTIIPAPTEYVQWALAIMKFYSLELCRIQTVVANLETLARGEEQPEATPVPDDSQVASMLELGLGTVPDFES